MLKTRIKPIFLKKYLNRENYNFRPFSQKNVCLYVLRNAYLHTRSTVLLDENFKIIKETAEDYALWGNPGDDCITKFPKDERLAQSNQRIESLQEKINEEIKETNINKIIKIDKLSINLLTPKSGYTFGHIFDYMQKAIVLRHFSKKDIIYLTSDHSTIKDFNSYLEAFKMHRRRCIIPHNLGKFLFFKRIIVAFSPSEIDHISSDIYKEYISKLKNNTLIHAEKYLTNKEIKLYLSRGKNASLGRRVLDEQILIEYLKDKNFIIVNGEETLPEITFLFTNAKFIFGLHGSLFLNTIHSKYDCKIIELNPLKDRQVSGCYKNKILNPERKENYIVLNINSDEKCNAKSQDVINIIKNYI
jgi:hypothetical protein